MKFKSLYMAGVCALALMATACEEEAKYTPAQPCPALPCYFSYSDAQSLKIGDGDTEATINLYRSEAGPELTVNVNITVDPNATPFTLPSTATFAEGETMTQIVLGVNTDLFEPGVNYTVDCVVGQGDQTPYFTERVSLGVEYAPWRTVIGPNGEEFALFNDVMVTALYNVTPSPATDYEVELQENPALPGIYRLVNPYKAQFPYTFLEAVNPAIETTYLYLNCVDPQKVFICNEKGEFKVGDKFTGYDSNVSVDPEEDGSFYMTSTATQYLFLGKEDVAEQYYGTLKDGVLTFPENGIRFGCSVYLGSTWDDVDSFRFARYSSDFRVVWPGVDPDAEPEGLWEDLGDAQFTDGIIAPQWDIFNEDGTCPTYTVPVQVNAENPAEFRLCNPWRVDNCPAYGEDYDGDVFLRIDCTMPEVVILPLQRTGVVDGERGEYWCFNYAYNYIEVQKFPAEKVIEDGANDIFKDGVITFGSEYKGKAWSNIYGYYPEWVGHESEIIPNQKEPWYYTIVVLPDAAKAKMKSNVITNGARYIEARDRMIKGVDFKHEYSVRGTLNR